jgi:2-C-methyl-D-erythritol 2,4-cyclodiphosphate synthase
MNYTIGTGVDIHGFPDEVSVLDCPDARFVAPDCLQLGLVEFAGFPKLRGHSDGDVATHALCDALLTASSLGDLGTLLGEDKPEWKNAPGEKILRCVLEAVQSAGFVLVSASVQIVAREPKLQAVRAQMTENYQKITGVKIGVGATTTDGYLAQLGSGEAIMAVANALLKRSVL